MKTVILRKYPNPNPKSLYINNGNPALGMPGMPGMVCLVWYGMVLYYFTSLRTGT
jgi:hypothetical protein